jgi:transposase
MRIVIINCLQDNNKEALECKVEKYLKDRKHSIRWTQPYSPDLQPIKLFWAAGKNNVANNSRYGIRMQEVVKLLQEGWYGKDPNDNESVDVDAKKQLVAIGFLTKPSKW